MSVSVESPIIDYYNTNWHPVSYRFELVADYC